MKYITIICFLLVTITMCSCVSGTSDTAEFLGNSQSHQCGYPTKKGTPCKNIVSDGGGFCHLHRWYYSILTKNNNNFFIYSNIFYIFVV